MATPVEPLKSSSFITIKNGSQKAPIFIIHGTCGRVQFSKLASHIRTDNPVYGIPARGLDGAEEPFDCIEDMSKFYLDELSHFYPDGPCILVGYSFGGLIALEMAHGLLQKGMRVSLLVLVDAYPHPRFLTPAQRKQLFIRKLRSHIGRMRRSSLSEGFAYFVRRFSRMHIFRSPSDRLAKTDDQRSSTLKTVESSAYEALANYNPRFYPGKINFVAADKKSFFPEDPKPIWAHLADELEVDVIPGDHLNIVTTEFEGLAAVITRYVRELTA
jgi:thioesterase domain-containing protein